MTPQELMDVPYATTPEFKREHLGRKYSDQYFKKLERIRSDVREETK